MPKHYNTYQPTPEEQARIDAAMSGFSTAPTLGTATGTDPYSSITATGGTLPTTQYASNLDPSGQTILSPTIAPSAIAGSGTLSNPEQLSAADAFYANNFGTPTTATAGTVGGTTGGTTGGGTPATGSVGAIPTGGALSAGDQQAVYNAAIGGGLTPEQAAGISGYTPPVETPGVAGSVAGLYAPSEAQTAEDAQAAAIYQYQQDQFNQEIDPNAIYQAKLAQYQAQVDSINALYADQLNQSRVRGQGRIESRQFAQGRAGQIGSGTGEAGINAVQDANEQILNSIRAQQANDIANVYAKVQSGADAELAEKRAAKQAGADALLTHLNAAPAKRKARSSAAIQALIAAGVNFEDMSPEEITSYVEGLGVSQKDFEAEFKSQTTAATAAQEKAQAEADKASAELANKEAGTAKTVRQTELLGKMTDAQRATHDENVRQFGIEQAFKQAESDLKAEGDEDSLTANEVKQAIFKQMATSEWNTRPEGMSKKDFTEQKRTYILSLGGNPDDYEL